MNQSQLEIPIQPVERPILCSPYEEPNAHWVYDTETGEAIRQPGRRQAGYWYKTQRTGSEQLQLFREEEWDDLPLVNRLRADVKRWRESNYRNATNVTRELLNHWTREDKERRLFFCQREAVETIIWLAEIRRAGKRTGFKPQFTDEALKELVDAPEITDLPELIRYGCKMATGSGKDGCNGDVDFLGVLQPRQSALRRPLPQSRAGRLPQPDNQRTPSGAAPRIVGQLLRCV